MQTRDRALVAESVKLGVQRTTNAIVGAKRAS
jgi:hypothetical protein